ncbi:MAG: acyl-CoA dehydrogenase family protein [Gammaproteobacteria bacterium]|nr:acyl-CoA dehydrogenase family protein [Gammaproteobacteria bacterium]
MDQFLPEEIHHLRESVIRFMETTVVPEMGNHEEQGVFPRDLILKAGEAGLYGPVFPESLGGSQMGFLAMAVVAEELARLDIGFSLCHNPQGMTCPYTIYAGGTEAQIKRYIPNLLSGKHIGCWALTEPGGGSDALGNMRTTAKRRGGSYYLNGSKMFITLGDQTDTGILFAKTDTNAGAKGVSAFIVEPKKYPGWEARPVEFVGLSQSLRSCEVFLDDFEVPEENLLGEEGMGFRYAMHAIQAGRVSVAARSVGLARACLDEAIQYVKEREVRGKPLANYQFTQGMIADALVNIESARLMTYHTAQLMDKDLPANRLSAQAKYAASLALKQAAGFASELFGGYALAKDYRIARLSSYAHVFLVGEGAPSVQRVLIAEDALGIKKADRHVTRYTNPQGLAMEL